MLNQLRKPNVDRCLEVFHDSLEEWSVSDWACAAAGECGEVCDAVKKLRRLETGAPNKETDPYDIETAVKAIGEEIADTIIYLDLLAARLNIDLDWAIQEKFNAVSKRLNSKVFIDTSPEEEKSKDYLVWDCKIVIPIDSDTPSGFDAPPRSAACAAVEAAGFEVLGCFSGWNGNLEKRELQVLESNPL